VRAAPKRCGASTFVRQVNGQETGEQTIQEIIKMAKPCNVAAGIMGVLLHNHGTDAVVQVLECPAEKVADLYNTRIAKDRRHSALKLLVCEGMHAPPGKLGCELATQVGGADRVERTRRLSSASLIDPAELANLVHPGRRRNGIARVSPMTFVASTASKYTAKHRMQDSLLKISQDALDTCPPPAARSALHTARL